MTNNDTKINELLGAKIFKKVVLKLEKAIHAVGSFVMPNLKDRYNTIDEEKLERLCRKAKTDKEREEIKWAYRNKNLMLRKSIINKQNMNYHFKGVDETIAHFNQNKKIHERSLEKNAVISLISMMLLLVASGVILTIGIILLIYSLIASFIDFQCGAR